MMSIEEDDYSRRSMERDAYESHPSSREPIDHPPVLEIPQSAPPPTEEPTGSIDDVLNRLIIHDDKPIENLPTMTAPELKLIGRCISLSTKQTINGATAPYFYTGLVSAVTDAAVTLIYVNRYTEEDFKVYRKREKTLLRTVNATAQEMATQSYQHGKPLPSEVDPEPHNVGVQQHGYSAAGEVGVDRDGGLTGHHDGAALFHVDAAGSLAPAVAMDFESHEETKAFNFTNEGEVVEGSAEGCDGAGRRAPRSQRPPDFRNCVASVGPLPFVSFLRKSIHDVRFGRDPRSSFYSLFQDPSKNLMDMQYLRMFVRRYIVHTSEGNNPRQVPLYAFVTVRCACPDLDHALANLLVREELPGLVRADRAIVKERERNRNREVRRGLAIQEYHAPSGLFAHTGVLYLTHIPHSTFLCALVILFFTIVFAVFLAVTFAVLADAFVMTYLSEVMQYFIASLCLWVFAGVSVVLHAINMHLPLRDNQHLIIGRAVLTLGAGVCCVITFVKLLGRMSNQVLYNFMAFRSGSLVCSFYNRYACSGFTSSCIDPLYRDPYLCRCSIVEDYSTACYYQLWSTLQIIIIPLLVFCVLIFLALIYSLFQLGRLWLIGRALSNRMNR